MMEKDKLYYFAHPYTIIDINGNNVHNAEEANFNLCCMRVIKLLKMGYVVYSPVCHTHPIHVRDPEFLQNNEYKKWIEVDDIIIQKTKFDGIILAPKWDTSRGCVRELDIFKDKELRVLFYKELVYMDNER